MIRTYIHRSAYQVVPVPSMSLPHCIQRISAHRRVAAPLAVTTGSKHARDEMSSSSSKHISNTVGVNGKERVLARVFCKRTTTISQVCYC